MIATPTIVTCMLFIAIVPNHDVMVTGLLLLTMTPSDDNGDVSERTKGKKNDEKKLLVNGKEKEKTRLENEKCY